MKREPLTSLRIVHSMLDRRIGAITSMVVMTIGDYLRLTQFSEENLEIQRRVLGRSKIYDRLQKDLLAGGTIPPIVLAIAAEAHLEHENGTPRLSSLQRLRPDHVYIVDGLQRTNHLRQVGLRLSKGAHEQDRERFYSREIRVEIWSDIRFAGVLYRMMLLNAAQTPMTLRHQLEVVSYHFVNEAKSNARGLEVFTETGKKRRVSPAQFKASDLVESFTAFLKRSPLIDAKSLVVDELDREDFLEHFESADSQQDMHTFFEFVRDLDTAVCRAYPPDMLDDERDAAEEHSITKGTAFLGTKAYLLGVAAAAGHYSSRVTRRVEFARAANALVRRLEKRGVDDPLALRTFNRVLPDLLKSSGKIGDTQREFVFEAFKRMLADTNAEVAIAEHWLAAARRVG